MASLWVDERDLKFQLHEVFKIGETLLGKGRYADHDVDMCNMVLDQAQKLAEVEIAPTYPDEVHRKPVDAEFKDGKFTVPESYHRVYKLYCEGGWMTTADQPEVGGQSYPVIVAAACSNMFLAANQAFTMYPGLTHGAARLVEDFFQHPLRNITLEKMYTGAWAGTMCLTEPGAGSAVGALKSTAKKNADGTYSITGTKCFITAGDHNLTPNIIHPVLARIEGDPAGTKGISIFIVPKYRVNDDGSQGVFNDVNCGGIEHKMGIKGSATATLNFGEDGKCIGELLGDERAGIKIMFQMMNEARLGTGMQGLCTASASYEHALAYAKERVQGAPIWEMKNPDAKAVTIINHPDVRKKLLWMKSHIEGLRSMIYFTANCFDMSLTAKTEEEKAKWEGYLDLMTQVVKAYSTDKGLLVCSLGMDVYGGYGYCQEYPAEQYMRDEKIATIYEGTNGIQSLDLVGRKLGQKKGANVMNMAALIQGSYTKLKANAELGKAASTLEEA